jgi:hypothetical protein
MSSGNVYVCRFEAWKPIYTDLGSPVKALSSLVLTDNDITYAVGRIIEHS